MLIDFGGILAGARAPHGIAITGTTTNNEKTDTFYQLSLGVPVDVGKFRGAFERAESRLFLLCLK